MFGKDKYFVYFVRKVNGRYKRIKKKRIYGFTKFVSYKKEMYHIDLDNYTFSIKNKFFYIIEYGFSQKKMAEPKEAEMLVFGDIIKDNPMSPRVLHKLLREKVIFHLSAGLTGDTVKINWILILIVLAFGILLGYNLNWWF